MCAEATATRAMARKNDADILRYWMLCCAKLDAGREGEAGGLPKSLSTAPVIIDAVRIGCATL